MKTKSLLSLYYFMAFIFVMVTSCEEVDLDDSVCVPENEPYLIGEHFFACTIRFLNGDWNIDTLLNGELITEWRIYNNLFDLNVHLNLKNDSSFIIRYRDPAYEVDSTASGIWTHLSFDKYKVEIAPHIGTLPVEEERYELIFSNGKLGLITIDIDTVSTWLESYIDLLEYQSFVINDTVYYQRSRTIRGLKAYNNLNNCCCEGFEYIDPSPTRHRTCQ